jgi:hypothetical protein
MKKMKETTMTNPELTRQLGEATAVLTEWQIQARRERKRQKRVSPGTREELRAAEALVTQLQQQRNQGASA